MVEELGSKKPGPFDIKKVKKGWGYELWIVNKAEYCGKLLYFDIGKCCSWHYHKIKDEVFYLQAGKLLVKYSEQDDIEKAQAIVKFADLVGLPINKVAQLRSQLSKMKKSAASDKEV